MAEVASETSNRIDRTLDYLVREWSAVPSYVRQFATWDELQQIAFVHEWGIRESELQVLQESVEQGLVTAAQRQRYDGLLRIVVKYRPLVEAVFSH